MEPAYAGDSLLPENLSHAYASLLSESSDPQLTLGALCFRSLTRAFVYPVNLAPMGRCPLEKLRDFFKSQGRVVGARASCNASSRHPRCVTPTLFFATSRFTMRAEITCRTSGQYSSLSFWPRSVIPPGSRASGPVY